MRKRNLPQINQSKKIKRERDPIPWRYCLLTLFCGVILVAGFFFAARTHFSSINFGIKNSKLKKEIEQLETDNRRLVLAKEIALTPSEIKKAAKKIGFTEMTAGNIEVVNAFQSKVSIEKSSVKPVSEKILQSAEVKKENTISPNNKTKKTIETKIENKDKTISKTGK